MCHIASMGFDYPHPFYVSHYNTINVKDMKEAFSPIPPSLSENRVLAFVGLEYLLILHLHDIFTPKPAAAVVFH